jgi:tetratricopeptide (TPR) repeat protein
LRQKRYSEALRIYSEARDTFTALGEPRVVAIAWHQMGIAYRESGQYEQSEGASQKALAISVQEKDRLQEARSLEELGNLYKDLGRLEEAVTFYRRAVDIYVELRNGIREGMTRSNMANILIKLERYDEARRELLRAVECLRPYGHAAELWKVHTVLHNLENAVGNEDAAAEARGKAMESYLAYRRAGGVSQSPGGQLYALVAQAVQQDKTDEAKQLLDRYFEANADPRVKAILTKLQAILNGDRNPALADDPELHWADAVELRLLLKELGAG